MAGLADLDRGHVWVAGVLSPLADSEGLVAWNSSGVLPARRSCVGEPCLTSRHVYSSAQRRASEGRSRLQSIL